MSEPLSDRTDAQWLRDLDARNKNVTEADVKKAYRPRCRACGFRDTATFTRTQLDVYDFACPTCPGGGRIELIGESA